MACNLNEMNAGDDHIGALVSNEPYGKRGIEEFNQVCTLQVADAAQGAEKQSLHEMNQRTPRSKHERHLSATQALDEYIQHSSTLASSKTDAESDRMNAFLQRMKERENLVSYLKSITRDSGQDDIKDIDP
uniref:Uncharacterized protein n=1 Tax=Trieres chinensis TaxID=1514140 RepID=A0A7S2EL73_TRICV|mmetsp:Transcript_27755/g.56886  ORF Transcript_27755/g.56886 Transcript_27755/m.56886 type:complete len:131 (+) Transcript_27755:47-439(+)